MLSLGRNPGLVDHAKDLKEVLDIHTAKSWYLKGYSYPLKDKTKYLKFKRAFDLIVGTILVILISPVLILCAIIIKIDNPGPVLFVQKRTGLGGHRFKIYKLRTMRTDAEELKKKYAHLNILEPPDFKIPNDPRITRIGHFLRKTSLDELPQFFNVVKGDMSLVGPRPTSFSSSTYDLWHTARLACKPGITGLWQVSGRNDIEFDDRVRLDVDYMKYMSFWLDMRIILRTFTAVINKEGE